LQLVELRRQPDHLIIGRHGVPDVHILPGDLLHQAGPHMHHLDVAVERDAVEARVVDIAVIQPVGVVEIVQRQRPFLSVVVELVQKARAREIAQPWREELQRVKAGVAGDELGDHVVIE